MSFFLTFISVTTTQRNIYNAIFLPEFLIFESHGKIWLLYNIYGRMRSLYYSAAIKAIAEQKTKNKTKKRKQVNPLEKKFTNLPFKVLGT